MADVDLLPPRGVPYFALVDANGIAIGGTSTTAQLAAKGMKAVCQVDMTGIALSDGTSTVALLASRGIRAFAAVDENGVSVDDAVTKVDVIRSRGIRPMVAVDANGLSQTGPATIPVIAQRGLSYFCPVDETGTAGSLIPVPPNTIRARPGIFTLTGEAMTPIAGYGITAGMGAFAMAGQSVNLVPPAGADAPATTAFLARVVSNGTTLDATHIAAYKTLINNGVSKGWFANCDALYVFATQDLPTARLNLVSSSYPLVNTSPAFPPTFTKDRGTAALPDGSQSFSTGFIPSTAGGLYTLNSAHIMEWANAAADSGGFDFGTVGGGIIAIVSNTAATGSQAWVNSSTNFTEHTSTGKGFYLAVRTNSTSVQFYWGASGSFNNTFSSTTNTSTTFASSEIDIMACNGQGSTTKQLSAASFGRQMSPTNAADFYNDLQAFMTAVLN